MLPLELKIKGFGPYLDASLSEEDFKLLQDSRVFLIFGEIGAGKTTLFDAILLALYGETSFPERKVEHLISHHIKPGSKVVPEVRFRFLFGKDEIEIVRRFPSLTPKGQDAYLWINKRLKSNRVSEVNRILKEILKLDAKQFKKVLLLPQGEYREVLLAEKKERMALFERLFQLEVFFKLAEFMKEKNKELKVELAKLNDQLSAYLKSSDAQTVEDLKEKIKINQEFARKLIDKKNYLEEELRKKEAELRRLEEIYNLLERKTKLEEEKKELLGKREEWERIEREVQRLRAFKEVLPYYEALRKGWKELKKLKQAEKDTLNELKKEGSKLEEIEKNLDKLLQEKERIYGLREKKTKLEDLLKLVEEERENRKKLRLLEEDLNKVSFESDRIAEEKEALNLILELARLDQTYQDLVDLEEVSSEYFKLEERVREVEEVLNKKKEEYEYLKDLSLLQRVAERLKEGDPCPLCGSTSHPAKACVSASNLQRLNKLSEEMKNLEEEVKKLRKKMGEASGKRKVLLERLKNQGIDVENLNEQAENIKKVLKELDERLPDKLRYIKNFSEKELKDRLKALERDEKNLLMKREELLQKKASLEEFYRSFKVRLSELGYDENLSLEEVKQELSILDEEITFFDSTFEELRKKREDSLRRLSGYQEKLDGIKNLLARELSLYKEALIKVFSLRKRGFFKGPHELKDAFARVGELETMEREVEEYKKRLFSVDKGLREVEEELRNKYPETLNKRLDEVGSELESFRRAVEDLRNEKEKIVEELARVSQTLEKFELVKKEVEKLSHKLDDLRKEQSLLEDIINLIDGKNQKSVSFQSYATSIFLDRLLRRANHYIKEFSFYRYSFVIEDALRRDFELCVFDIYTGKPREVRTLSGGESFIAVLAFALGVSDLMQALAGTRPFKSFFIDEGFGNLDSQTLNRVVDILVEVSQKKDQVIGIISHLYELKDRFPARIEVIKRREGGSKLKVVRVFK